MASGNYGGGECVPQGRLAEPARSSGRTCHWHWEPSDCSIVERSESKGRSVCCALCLPLECSTRLGE
ncbi:unnamed protein product [Staurois parvus]|uniref:Uncharacterized protein n=1 Tax=Staurois parvus TaxID=386267 RepID=A0ABN9E013_9NEOB|nr:unnamed protein product [Staurois parvus]